MLGIFLLTVSSQTTQPLSYASLTTYISMFPIFHTHSSFLLQYISSYIILNDAYLEVYRFVRVFLFHFYECIYKICRLGFVVMSFPYSVFFSYSVFVMTEQSPCKFSHSIK